MARNGQPTAGDLKLARTVRRLTPPGGSALAASVAGVLGEPVEVTKRHARAAEAHGVAYLYTYQGETRIGLSNLGWDLTEPAKRSKRREEA